MKTLIGSIKARISAETGATAYFVSVPESPSYPYVLLWTSAGSLEQNTLGGDKDLADRLGVTMVDTTANNVLVLAPRVRAALVGFTPASDTWAMEWLREPYDSRPIEYDRDVNIPGRGYPHFGVDMYYLNGTVKPATTPEP